MAAGLSKRCPTGITGVDRALNGGIPYTVAMVIGSEPGGGAREFVHSICAQGSLMIKRKTPSSGNVVPPRTVTYLSLSKPRSDILLETSWLTSFREPLENHLTFFDLSSIYFGGEPTVTKWEGTVGPIDLVGQRNLLESLSQILNQIEPESLVVLDSIADLFSLKSPEFPQLISFLKTLQIGTNRWRMVLLLLHSSGQLEEAQESAVLDACDGAIHFSREAQQDGSSRYKLQLNHLRGIPVGMSGLERLFTVVTPAGMSVLDLQRVQ